MTYHSKVVYAYIFNREIFTVKNNIFLAGAFSLMAGGVFAQEPAETQRVCNASKNVHETGSIEERMLSVAEAGSAIKFIISYEQNSEIYNSIKALSAENIEQFLNEKYYDQGITFNNVQSNLFGDSNYISTFACFDQDLTPNEAGFLIKGLDDVLGVAVETYMHPEISPIPGQ